MATSLRKRKTTATGRVVYDRPRHFFTERDVTRILYNMHDSNHNDIFWQLFSMLILEFRIILDSLFTAYDILKFLREIFGRFWYEIIELGLGKADRSLWDIVGTIGITRPTVQ